MHKGLARNRYLLIFLLMKLNLPDSLYIKVTQFCDFSPGIYSEFGFVFHVLLQGKFEILGDGLFVITNNSFVYNIVCLFTALQLEL